MAEFDSRTLDMEAISNAEQVLFDACNRDPYTASSVALMIYIELCEKYRTDKLDRKAIAELAKRTIINMEWFDHGTMN